MRRIWALALALVLLTGNGLPAQGDPATDACPSTIPVAPFSDTGHLPPASVAAISCIAHYGIALGTTPTTFSPAGAVSRSHLALFLVRTAGALGVELPDGEVSPFEDVDGLGDLGLRSVSRLWQLGITQGTEPGRFSPDQTVSRRQMVLFLHRLLQIADLPMTVGTPMPSLRDLAGLSRAVVDAIRYLAGLGIEWPGASELFEPQLAVTREEMALLLAASLDAGDARHVRLRLELSASSAPTSGAVVATVTATRPDGDPYRGLLVDVFVSQGHWGDGTCLVDRDARVNGADGGTSVDCTIDKADPKTDHRGEVRVGLAHSPVAERDRVFAWVGPLGQEYEEEKIRDQVWADLEWLEIPNRVSIEDEVDQEFGTLARIKARLMGENQARQRLIMLVVRQGVTVHTRAATTSFNGQARFGYRGPPDPSVNNDPELVDVIRVFWDRNGNGVYDGPAELSDETTATWDD